MIVMATKEIIASAGFVVGRALNIEMVAQMSLKGPLNLGTFIPKRFLVCETTTWMAAAVVKPLTR